MPRRILSLHVAVAMRLELEPRETWPGSELAAREVAVGEVDALLEGAGLLVERAAEVGRVPWRAFVVFADGRPIHHTFATLERSTPRLFKVYTHRRFRGRGAFGLAVRAASRALLEDGYGAIDSSCSAANAPSIAAHRRAGFREIRRTFHPYVLGVDLRAQIARTGRKLPRGIRRLWT